MTFLYPYAFLLLIFLPLFFLEKRKKIKVNPKIIVNKNSNRIKRVFLALAYIFLVTALARPVTDKKEISTSINLKKVALALDISRSMLAEDVYPNRLTFAKRKMEQFIDKFKGEMAILAFSNNTFLVSPYTSDKETLKYLLKNINQNYITSSGTDFQNLVDTAKKMGYKDIVVFTDGDDVKNLNTKGVNLYALLIGTAQGAPIKLKNGTLLMKNGKVVIVKRNDNFLKVVKFGVIAKVNASDIDELISQNFRQETNSKKIIVYKELFIYPLWAGVLFLFLSFFSLPSFKKFQKVAPLIILLIGVHSKGSILDWYYLKKAKEAYQHEDYKKSAQFYEKVENDDAKFNRANALYKMQKYDDALKLYNQIKDKNLAEKVAYNKGNCYAKEGKIDDAINAYKDALKINPNDKDAKFNLKLLEQLKRKKQQKPQQKNSKNNQNSQKNGNKNSSQNSTQKNSKNSNSKEKQGKQKNSTQKTQNNSQNSRASQKRVDKQNSNDIKPIQFKEKRNDNENIFDKIKTQTILYPLSEGTKNDENNQW